MPTEFGGPPLQKAPKPVAAVTSKSSAFMQKKIAGLQVWVWLAFLSIAIIVGLYLRNRQQEPQTLDEDIGSDFDYDTIPASLGGGFDPDMSFAPQPDKPDRVIPLKPPPPGMKWCFRTEGGNTIAFPCPRHRRKTKKGEHPKQKEPHPDPRKRRRRHRRKNEDKLPPRRPFVYTPENKPLGAITRMG